MTHKEQNKILDDKIESNINQYKVDRLNAEISAFSSGDLNKYEFLTKKDLNYKPNALDKARFEFSPLGRAFNEGLDKTIPNYQEEGAIKLLKEIRDNFAGGINIPAGFLIRPGLPGSPGPGGQPRPQGPQGPQGPIPPVPPAPPLIIPKPKTPSSQKPRLRPKLPSEKIESDDGDLIDNKELDDFINNIKNKKSRNLVNKKINDIVNNIGNKKLEDPSDTDFSLDSDTLTDLVDKINKDESDQIENDELAKLTMAKLLPGQLKLSESIRQLPDLSRTRTRTSNRIIKPNIPINTKKATSKELEDADNILDEYLKKVLVLVLEKDLLYLPRNMK